nr:MAG TPA: hypothetical protein [Caudoviricetes sp.]DAI19907.1 MAG TPA: hypothetical protein [Caudoviricetes sp.]
MVFILLPLSTNLFHIIPLLAFLFFLLSNTPILTAF